ncbi:Detected protein of confused Function [Hibiscus syriacus]|uniref:Detected protein of confused Function n=1 Tax=Hibiscus syriacus TaxID=106335 RepID=A0A6A2Y4F7_HIBSY|nr:protein PLANT CADMIUM RESISTANCE 11-like [Hibiscus syriacus]KAE8667289.1 Detected protein of confused Function [Hibiscus syriacus]
MAMYPTDQPPPQQCLAPSYQYGQPAPPPFAGPVTTPSQQYPMQNYYMHPAGKVLWSTGVCDCCYDIRNCIITLFCPCITFGQIAEIVDHGSVSCIANGIVYSVIQGFLGLACLYSCFYRTRMRHQFMLAETPYPDWCIHIFCEQCALCQEFRELQNRGFDMYIGWDANMEKFQRQAMQMSAPPVVEDGMKR